MSLRDYEILAISCLFWLGVGWSIGRWRKEEAERRKEEQRFKRMIWKKRH